MGTSNGADKKLSFQAESPELDLHVSCPGPQSPHLSIGHSDQGLAQCPQIWLGC